MCNQSCHAACATDWICLACRKSPGPTRAGPWTAWFCSTRWPSGWRMTSPNPLWREFTCTASTSKEPVGTAVAASSSSPSPKSSLRWCLWSGCTPWTTVRFPSFPWTEEGSVSIAYTLILSYFTISVGICVGPLSGTEYGRMQYLNVKKQKYRWSLHYYYKHYVGQCLFCKFWQCSSRAGRMRSPNWGLHEGMLERWINHPIIHIVWFVYNTGDISRGQMFIIFCDVLRLDLCCVMG